MKKMKFIRTAMLRHGVNGMLLYDGHGRKIYLDDLAARVFALLSTPMSLQEILSNIDIDITKLNQLIVWGHKNGFLSTYSGAVNSVLDKESELQVVYSFPSSIAIYPTYSCNQKCTFCYTSSGPDSSPVGQLSHSQWVDIVQKLLEYKVTNITILGGEPFLLPDLLLDILKMCKDKCFIRIFTNGTANNGITDELVKKLAGNFSAEVIFSIYSSMEEKHNKVVRYKNALSTLLQSAQTLINNTNLIISAATTITKDNVDELDSIANILIDYKFKRFELRPIMPSKRMDNFYDCIPSPKIIEKQVERAREVIRLRGSDLVLSYHYDRSWNSEQINTQLFWGKRKIKFACQSEDEAHIDPYGLVYNCPLVIGNKEKAVANILSNDFDVKWEKSFWEYDRGDDWEVDEPCKGCPDIITCHGGCPLVAKQVFGDIKYADPYCSRVYIAHLEEGRDKL